MAQACDRCGSTNGAYEYTFGGAVIEVEISGYLCLACGGAVKRFIANR